MADQPNEITGLRREANGLWRCASVDRVFYETYLTTIELQAPDDGKT
ncbi:hypothetical protein [Chelativorans sp. YIM 93263]|nr:hypothetical protein [Chelativorans sp. YIM 93263]